MSRAYVRPTNEAVIEYISQPVQGVIGLSNTEPTYVALEVTDELRDAHRDASVISAVDLVDNEPEQVRRFHRVIFRKARA